MQVLVDSSEVLLAICPALLGVYFRLTATVNRKLSHRVLQVEDMVRISPGFFFQTADENTSPQTYCLSKSANVFMVNAGMPCTALISGHSLLPVLLDFPGNNSVCVHASAAPIAFLES